VLRATQFEELNNVL